MHKSPTCTNEEKPVHGIISGKLSAYSQSTGSSGSRQRLLQVSVGAASAALFWSLISTLNAGVGMLVGNVKLRFNVVWMSDLHSQTTSGKQNEPEGQGASLSLHVCAVAHVDSSSSLLAAQ